MKAELGFKEVGSMQPVFARASRELSGEVNFAVQRHRSVARRVRAASRREGLFARLDKRDSPVKPRLVAGEPYFFWRWN
ncbi:MAG: hypothetical protein WA919_29110 [Coleofasciculaceae cyanobacterium]